MKMKDKDTIVIEVKAAQIVSAILQQLAEEDVVQVVRCKDCKWWKKKLLGGSCELNIRLMSNDNWYCADGERREANEQEERVDY